MNDTNLYYLFIIFKKKDVSLSINRIFELFQYFVYIIKRKKMFSDKCPKK